MIKKEWSSFIKNWWLKIVIIAIIAIPSIYAGVFLGSIWDPYGNTQDLPVAVVNEDKEVLYNDTTLAIGKELAKSLQENTSMNFKLVENNQANQGLSNGDYYMVITIPDDFSKNATTLLDAKPQKMILNYTTNPGSSYIASKMDDSAIAKIKAEVSATVTKTYAQTIFEQLSTIGSGMNDAADGSSQINDGVNQLADGNKTISDNLQVLATSSITFKDGASTLTNGLQDYTDGVITVNNGVYSLKDGISELNNATPALSSGINQLNDGANGLLDGVNQYTNGVAAAYQGTQQLVSSNGILSNGVKALGNGTTELKEGNQQIVKGLNDLASSITASTTGDNKENLDKLEKGYQTIQQYQSLINQLNANDVTKQYASKLITDGFSADEAATITGGHITAAMPSYVSVLETVSDGSKTAVSNFTTGLTAINTGVNDLLTGANTIQAGITNLDSSVNGGVYINKDGTTTTVSQQNSLKGGLQTYLAGTSQINDGLALLDEKSSALMTGTGQLKQGTSQLANQTPALTSGISALNQGANQLANGTTALTNNNSTLLGGAGQLAKGASQISDGASQLADGSNTLGEGLTTLQDGSNTLASSLNDGAKQVNDIKTTDDTIDMMATPVDTAHQEISTVENNGHGMAPYMMSVGLYVACMAFTLMYPLFNDIEKAESGFKYWLSKATVWFSVSIVAALVMIASLIFFCDFSPEQLLMTFIFAILVGAGSMALVTLLSIVCGKIGEFVLLVYMVINLGCSAGTYPLETSGSIFQALHPFVPFTYSVDGFRKVISMNNISIHTEIMVFAGIIIICSLLAIIAYQHRIKKPTPLIPQAFENVNE